MPDLPDLDPRCFTRKVERLEDTLGGRSHFTRDYQAIIHSVAFRRLRHKTQVFFLAEDDTVCTRIEHVLAVASVATTICKQLGLNDELAQAIGVGHDLGHAPFGHAGEQAIRALRPGEDFRHETHGVRVADYIERRGNGLNLTLAVLDGIAHHSGESRELDLVPNEESLARGSLFRSDVFPGTLEACVVRLSDRIAFIGRDLVDAVHAGIIQATSLPREPMHEIGCRDINPERDPMDFNSKVINYFVTDLVRSSNPQDNRTIKFSEAGRSLMEELYQYSDENIYNNPQIQREIENVGKIISTIFQEFSTLYDQYAYQPDKYQDHIPGVDARAHVVGHLGMFMAEHEGVYLEIDEGERKNRLLVDFIATFADNEAVRAFQDLVHPKKLI